MNERVEDVNQKVYWIWMMAASTVSPLKTGGAWQKDFVKVFAELIVRECALVAKTLPHTPERDWILDSVTHIPVHCEQNILKHFGVKP